MQIFDSSMQVICSEQAGRTLVNRVWLRLRLLLGF